jgi:hypothetical protein
VRVEDEGGLGEMQLYGSRFLVLGSFCCFSFIQSLGWFTYAGFQAQTEKFYGVDDAMIGYYLLLGPIFFVAATPLFLYLLDKKGLRVSVILGALCVLVGAVSRTVALFTGPAAGWPLAMLGGVGSAIAGVVAMAVSAAEVHFSDFSFPVSRHRPRSAACGSGPRSGRPQLQWGWWPTAWALRVGFCWVWCAQATTLRLPLPASRSRFTRSWALRWSQWCWCYCLCATLRPLPRVLPLTATCR